MPYVKKSGEELWYREDVYEELLKNCQKRAWIYGLCSVLAIVAADFVLTSLLKYQQSVCWLDVFLGAGCSYLVWTQLWHVRKLEQWFAGYPTRDSCFIPPSEEVDKE